MDGRVVGKQKWGLGEQKWSLGEHDWSLGRTLKSVFVSGVRFAGLLLGPSSPFTSFSLLPFCRENMESRVSSGWSLFLQVEGA